MGRKKGMLYEWMTEAGMEIGIKYHDGDYVRIHCGGCVTVFLQDEIALDVVIEMDGSEYFAMFDDENGVTRNLRYLNDFPAALPVVRIDNWL